MSKTIRKRAGICPECKKRNHPLAPDTEGDICDDCQKQVLEKSSVIICNKCNRLAGFVQHGATPEGFEFEKGKEYHVENCIKCMPVATQFAQFKIIELEQYLKDKDVPKSDNMFEGI